MEQEEHKQEQNETKNRRTFRLKPKQMITLVCILVIAAIAAGLWFRISGQIARNRDKQADITTMTTLEQIIDVSELSTFTAVYNGVAEVHNEQNPEAIDYYVSYEAKINAGIDFSQIAIDLKEEEKVVQIQLPPAEIQTADVDIGSLDFIFYNNGANTSAVTQQAYQACKDDVKAESARQGAIVTLAQQNAENVIRALTEPYLQQFYRDYTLEIL